MAALLRSVSSPSTSGVAICSTLIPPRCSVTGSVTLRLTGTSKMSGSVPSSEIDSEAKPPPGAAPRSSTRSDEADRLVDDGEGGRGLDDDAAVPVVGAAGQEHLHRTGEARERVGVVHFAVGDQDRAGDAVGRQLGRRLGERGQELGAVLAAVGDMHGVHLEGAALPEPVEPGLEPGQRLGELGVAAVDAVRGAVVEHDDRDVRHRRPVLAPERRPGERGEQHQRREPAQPPAGQPAPERHGDRDERQRRQRRDQRQRQMRGEGDRLHATGPAGRAAPARAPGRICSCRSSRT